MRRKQQLALCSLRTGEFLELSGHGSNLGCHGGGRHRRRIVPLLRAVRDARDQPGLLAQLEKPRTTRRVLFHLGPHARWNRRTDSILWACNSTGKRSSPLSVRPIGRKQSAPSRTPPSSPGSCVTRPTGPKKIGTLRGKNRPKTAEPGRSRVRSTRGFPFGILRRNSGTDCLKKGDASPPARPRGRG